MTDRNSPCACGSGKKYKHCHGLIVESQVESSQSTLQQAIVLFQQGRKEEAYSLASKLPNSVERCRLLVTILIGRHQPSDIAKALKLIEKWKRIDRASPEPWARQIEIHIFKQQLALAQQAFKEMHRRAPSHTKTLYYKGLLLQLGGQLEKAHLAFRESIMAGEGTRHDKVISGDKNVNVMAALMVYDTAAGTHPGTRTKSDLQLLDQPAVTALLQSCLEQRGNEIQASGETVSIKDAQNLARGWYNLGCADLGSEDSAPCFHKALEWNEDYEKARRSALFVLNYSTRLTAEEIYQEHRISGQKLQQRYPDRQLVFQNDRSPTRALRVAYLSADFRHHPVAHFILPVLQQHDPKRVTVFLYYNHNKVDDYTKKFRQIAHRFRQVQAIGDDELSLQIIEDRIDILVDLNGQSESGRMPLLAGRPAPIQINWIGYPNTTGLETVDYRIVDEVTDPKPRAQELCTEQLLYMPHSFSVYHPLDDLPPVVTSPCLKSGTVTFGSFNNIYKVNDGLLLSWVKILNRVPGSRLLIKDAALKFTVPRQRILEVLRHCGIDSSRIDLHGPTQSRFEHLEYFQAVDISLDSFPYNGTTTSCESLIMGVPVVTRAGEDHRSRVTASQLSSLKLESLIAHDESEYIEIAAGLALNHELLQSVRDCLRERMHTSPLMDAAGFTRDLESAYQGVWAKWCEQNAGPE